MNATREAAGTDPETYGIPDRPSKVPTKTKRLRIVQASFLFSLSNEDAAHDIRKLLTLNADIYMGTESGDSERKAMFRHHFEIAGYVIFLPEGTDAWIAVRNSLAGHGHVKGYRQLWGTGKQEHDQHHYDAKGVTWFMFHHPLLGNVALVECHYMRTAVEGDKALHMEVNRKLAHGLVDKLLALTGGQDDIGFFGADTNMLDQHADIFFGRPMTTCWDELHKHPNTGHGNIDVIGSCDQDKRVRCHSAKVFDDKEFFLHADHYVVIAEYDVYKL